MAKINQQWRQTLREIKCLELKQDLEDLFKWFNYTTNKKNAIIETLLADLEEAEAQHCRIHQCHVEIIDKLIVIRDQRIDHFQNQYNHERDDLNQKVNADLADIVNSFSAGEENLKATLHRMEENHQDDIAVISSRHRSKMDELRNNMLTEFENLRNPRELQIEKIWHNLQMVLKQYWDQTEDRRRQYLIKSAADYEHCKQIFENNQQINGIIDVITNLKECFIKNQKADNKRFLKARADKENSRKVFHLLKKKVVRDIERDEKNLKFMNSVADKTTQELKKILAKGEQILQLQSLCRKLETLGEKIYTGEEKPQLTKEEEIEVQNQFKKYGLTQIACSESDALGEFWKRYNRVLLEKEALALHHQALLNEQKQLKSVLRSYLTEYAIKQPESKMSHANGVYYSQPRPLTGVLRERKNSFSMVTCIDAAQSPSIRQLITSQMRKSCS